MRDPVFPTFCALSLVLLLLVLPTHVRARNSGTLLYIGWTFVTTLIYFVNSLVWAGNLSNPAPVWCDISTKIIVGSSAALAATSLCINRRLYQITHPTYAHTDASTKRHTLIFDLSVGVGIPVLVMILHTVVQGHRYDVFEDIGCYPVTYTTLLNIPMVFMWPILLGFVSLFYSFFTISELVNRRRQFSSALSKSRYGLNTSQYFRLMALAATDLLFSLPLSLFVLISNLRKEQNPWISWADTHQNFGRVDFVPWAALELVPEFLIPTQVARWTAPVFGIVFFLYFGVAGEAMMEYRRWFWAIAGRFGYKKPNGSVHVTNWSNRIASNPSASAQQVSFPSARPTNSLDRAPKNNLVSQLQSRDSFDLDSLNRSGDLEAPKPPQLK